MSKRLIGVLVLVLAVLLWLFFNPQSKNKKGHVLEHQSDTMIKVKAEQKVQAKNKQDNLEKGLLTQPNQIKNEAIDFDGLSFMALYRMYRQANLCQKYFTVWRRTKYEKSAFDYIDHIWGKDKENLVRVGYIDSDLSMSLSKEKMAKVYANQCESLLVKWNATIQGGVSLNDPETTMLYLLLKKKTTTPKEAALKELLKIQKQLPELSQEVADSMQGEDFWTEEQIEDARQRIKHLFTQVVKDGAFDNAAVIAHNKEIFAEIAEINKQLKEQKLNSTFQAQAAINAMETTLMAAEKYSYNNDPDIFLLAKFITELNPNFSVMSGFSYKSLSEYFYSFDERNSYEYQYQTPTSKFMQAVNLTSENIHFYFITLGAVNELYYCSLGADCGPESPLMLTKCLGLRGVAKNDACGQSLMDYYFNGNLTSGQLYDVDWLLAAMEQYYAP